MQTIFRYTKDNMLYTVLYEYAPVTGRKIAVPYNWQGKQIVIKTEAQWKRFVPVASI